MFWITSFSDFIHLYFQFNYFIVHDIHSIEVKATESATWALADKLGLENDATCSHFHLHILFSSYRQLLKGKHLHIDHLHMLLITCQGGKGKKPKKREIYQVCFSFS
jgi:hypothetical protein